MYLTKVVETYRISTEKEVENFLKELKADKRFTIGKYSSVKKQKKSKGEILDEWIHFEVTKIFNDEKEPNTIVDIDYNVDEKWNGPSIEGEEEE
jgi:hypothetical protein